MVQRKISISEILPCVDNGQTQSDADSTYCRLRALPSTAVKIIRNRAGEDELQWVRGDKPRFEGSEVIVGEPNLEITQESFDETQRQPNFEANEYCRLLHVLADSRMLVARAQMMEPRSRDELDGEFIDPWSDYIPPMYNDVNFKPEPCSSVCGGVTRDDIISIDPGQRKYERLAGTLKRKFGEFKSLYGTAVTRFEASGQGDPDGFALYAYGKVHLMYAFCFLERHPFLQPLATRVLQSDAQREEGVGEGVGPADFSAPMGSRGVSPGHRKKRTRSVLGEWSHCRRLYSRCRRWLRARQKRPKGIKRSTRLSRRKAGRQSSYCLPSMRRKI
ncbi:unnamed protein product [Chondrus crispus]|uniref:Uncharacterized protein n=1 Tax=Chondrus crispus TaxID=2769 RepID=R7Q9D6_CHOCR|nr:unnamed protein product [Chondrus crispus]CDF35152.1 unnamed protein product [Chondrus crispus]|eukprot:XP_005714971.1 unnamed protein product [Chondrus crispus]